jgi:protein-histidine pros-kinase
MPAPVASQLLRIAQEALTNVRRHAHASHVQVLLRQHEDRLELEIVDDGGG